MKLIITILVTVALFISTSISAQNKMITATVLNVTSNSGKVGFALYDKETFMKTPIQAKNANIVNGKSTVIFENLEAGEYAVICFHDSNNNDKMDFHPNGMPLEDFGASNNDMSFGPPSYEKAKFVVIDKNVSLDIKF